MDVRHFRIAYGPTHAIARSAKTAAVFPDGPHDERAIGDAIHAVIVVERDWTGALERLGIRSRLTAARRLLRAALGAPDGRIEATRVAALQLEYELRAAHTHAPAHILERASATVARLLASLSPELGAGPAEGRRP